MPWLSLGLNRGKRPWKDHSCVAGRHRRQFPQKNCVNKSLLFLILFLFLFSAFVYKRSGLSRGNVLGKTIAAWLDATEGNFPKKTALTNPCCF